MYIRIKPILDFFVALLILIITFPIMLIVAILIKIEDPSGPVLFKQIRIGKDNKEFVIYKFRSMYVGAPDVSTHLLHSPEKFITRIGKFIRKTSIDELPQLFNILKGDMSLVGPRPERAIFTLQFNNDIDGFVNRLLVKPGLTGLAQINGGYDTTPKEKFEWDMEYIRKRSIILDLKIMIKTIKVIITGDGAR